MRNIENRKEVCNLKQAVFHGQEMWIGIADVASGTIRETHTLEEAKRADFHTCFYFSEESEKKHENKDGIFFWVQDGKVELEYNDLSPYEKTLLETQIKAQVIILDQDESVLRKTMLSERQENNNRDGNRMQIQILYSCNEWKEHSSMKIVCATTNPEVLYALIGESIKAGDMEYGCEDKEKGWELFQQDYGKQQIRLELLQYGFVESMPNLSISDKTSIRNYSEVYLVYTALHNQRAEEILRPLHLDRQCLIYSMADVHSDYGSNQIILSGFGKEEALRASELFEAYLKCRKETKETVQRFGRIHSGTCRKTGEDPSNGRIQKKKDRRRAEVGRDIHDTRSICGAGLCESRTGTVRYHSMPDIHSTPVSSIPCIGNRSLFFREWECRKADKTKKGRNRVRTSEICSDHHTGTDGKQGYLIHAGKLSEECRPGTQE